MAREKEVRSLLCREGWRGFLGGAWKIKESLVCVIYLAKTLVSAAVPSIHRPSSPQQYALMVQERWQRLEQRCAEQELALARLVEAAEAQHAQHAQELAALEERAQARLSRTVDQIADQFDALAASLEEAVARRDDERREADGRLAGVEACLERVQREVAALREGVREAEEASAARLREYDGRLLRQEERVAGLESEVLPQVSKLGQTEASRLGGCLGRARTRMIGMPLILSSYSFFAGADLESNLPGQFRGGPSARARQADELVIEK